MVSKDGFEFQTKNEICQILDSVEPPKKRDISFKSPKSVVSIRNDLPFKKRALSFLDNQLSKKDKKRLNYLANQTSEATPQKGQYLAKKNLETLGLTEAEIKRQMDDMTINSKLPSIDPRRLDNASKASEILSISSKLSRTSKLMASERFAPSAIGLQSHVSSKIGSPRHYTKQDTQNSSKIYKTDKSVSRNEFEKDLIGIILEQKKQHDFQVKLQKKQEKAEVRDILKVAEKEEAIKK